MQSTLTHIHKYIPHTLVDIYVRKNMYHAIINCLNPFALGRSASFVAAGKTVAPPRV